MTYGTGKSLVPYSFQQQPTPEGLKGDTMNVWHISRNINGKMQILSVAAPNRREAIRMADDHAADARKRGR
jgi:hypothetical protein